MLRVFASRSSNSADSQRMHRRAAHAAHPRCGASAKWYALQDSAFDPAAYRDVIGSMLRRSTDSRGSWKAYSRLPAPSQVASRWRAKSWTSARSPRVWRTTFVSWLRKRADLDCRRRSTGQCRVRPNDSSSGSDQSAPQRNQIHPQRGRYSRARHENALTGEAAIEVKDTGRGIPTAHHHRIFERFYRVDQDRSRRLRWVGLGLAIARWAVEANGGRSIETKTRREPKPSSKQRTEGERTAFRIVLPKPALFPHQFLQSFHGIAATHHADQCPCPHQRKWSNISQKDDSDRFYYQR